MAKSINTNLIKTISNLFTALLIISASFNGHAAVAEKVTTYKDNNGWKIQVGGKDHYVKGVVWGYTPRGENHTYSLWNKPEQHIRDVLDHEFGLMKAANINTIRAFSTIPAKWVTYAYQEYGIMTAINPLMGRYGAEINGVWTPKTDYSDPVTREHLKAEVAEIVEKYKGVPGVIMVALGNESNYGLEWSADFEIENLPEGEQHKEKARFLYSLYYELIKEGKEIDPDRLFSIVNGDLQYMDLIKEYVTNLDVLGVNAYRGISFTDLWKRADEELDLPVLFFEFGADAFNSKEFVEDQASQAEFLRAQWQEMYNKSYGNGQEGNSVGGFVFEWRDEWWKYKQVEFLEVHNTHASWANGGYTYDYVEGQNNMNEEWWGIMRLGPMNAQGIYVAEPRAAYYVLGEIWSLDPYKHKTAAINTDIQNINMDLYSLKGEFNMIKSEASEKKKFEMTGGSLSMEFVGNAFSGDIDEDGEDAVNNSNGQMVFMDFEFNPSKDITGQFSINILGNVPNRTMEFQYGDRGRSYNTIVEEEILDDAPVNERTITDNERIEIYDYNGTYTAENYDLETFYHTPRFHWGYEGDYFGLLRETTDMASQDVWNSKAPFGAEFAGKQSLDGLKFLFGPEVYWGANPKYMLKYEFGEKIGASPRFALLHSEDVARRDTVANPGEAVAIQTRQTTLYSKFGSTKNLLEIGGIMASTEKIGDKYNYIENGDVLVNEIDFEDTLGVKATYSFEAFGASRAYVGLHYAGLTADGGATQANYGYSNGGILNYSQLPYSDLGNKQEIETGIQMNFGSITVLPRLMYRENLVDANPNIPPVSSGTTLDTGVSARNRDDDAFAVLGNREARSGEVFLTYDPTPATGFYEWDNDRREDADFAFNIGGNYTSYPTATDSYQFFYRPSGTNVAFGEGLIAEDVWKIMSRMVMNTEGGTNVILNLEGGYQQSSGSPDGPAREYYKTGAKFWLTNDHIIEGYAYKDAWAPYDFYRQFNQTYPWQFMLDYSVLMGPYSWADTPGSTSKWGVRGLYRTLDDQSPEDEYQDGRNDGMFEVVLYATFTF
jgi:beta-galactosidase